MPITPESAVNFAAAIAQYDSTVWDSRASDADFPLVDLRPFGAEQKVYYSHFGVLQRMPGQNRGQLYLADTAGVTAYQGAMQGEKPEFEQTIDAESLISIFPHYIQAMMMTASQVPAGTPLEHKASTLVLDMRGLSMLMNNSGISTADFTAALRSLDKNSEALKVDTAAVLAELEAARMELTTALSVKVVFGENNNYSGSSLWLTKGIQSMATHKIVVAYHKQLGEFLGR
jgi:hypothetical protein